PLPQPWFDADRDGDGTIDASEFRQLLRNLDPGLLRWAQRLLQRLDKNGDGKLSPAEVSPPTGATAAPERPPRKGAAEPVVVPQR
ncbi:MAG TPA: EF-hand domain-containing protein, partial [bacterium]|nr:EF-hand domain-containing protein [bacterium]